MDAAYNAYNSNAMGIGLAAATSLNNAVQSMSNQTGNNEATIADAIGINMVERDVQRAYRGGTRSNATKKAKFTPSSKYKIELRYSNYIENKHQSEVRKMSDDVVSAENHQEVAATKSAPSIICQRLSEKITPVTNQLEKRVVVHSSAIGMNSHVFASSCRPIKVNNASITHCRLNSETLESYYGKPVESVRSEANSGIDVSTVNQENVTQSIDDAFKLSSVSLDDTLQVPSMSLDSNVGKQEDVISKPSTDTDMVSDREIQQMIGIPDKRMEPTSEYNVDSLFKKDVDTSFQLPTVDSLKSDSIDVVSDISYDDSPKKDERSIKQDRINEYIGASSSQDSLMKLKEAITKEAEKNANLQQVVGTYESEIIDAEKERQTLQERKREAEEKVKKRYESFVQTNETLDRARQQMEEDLQKTQTDISNIMSEIEQLNAMLEVKVPSTPSINRGKRGK